MTRWFEEIVTNEPIALGSHTFTEQEIIRFGKRYDPQYFHIDPEAARHSHFGGLIASGWHTVSVGHRKMVDRLEAEEETVRAEGGTPGVSGPSPGVNRMDFKAPVRPGDTVSYTLTVTGKRASNSLPGWGLLFNLIEAHNQHGELVYSADLVGFSKLRDYRMPLRLRLAMALRNIPGIGKVFRR
ncbi:MaoC/PaaZ C-terminal domain-containing protein [Pelagibacterium sediminicola]|uniref:MaoC/PaaZ C-terminal domain-containing protein n=1 Tax=Pelagibacterium sediminicola TaxID=2248761 RepID=UPI000E321B45|nr:MaoC/PaaZ C-terminal domain-containing protein [Pelagibacterium sediminicola]